MNNSITNILKTDTWHFTHFHKDKVKSISIVSLLLQISCYLFRPYCATVINFRILLPHMYGDINKLF